MSAIQIKSTMSVKLQKNVNDADLFLSLLKIEGCLKGIGHPTIKMRQNKTFKSHSLAKMIVNIFQ